MSFTITDIARIGPNMQLAVRLVAENGAYPTIAALGEEVAPGNTRSTGEDAVRRCLNRGLLAQDTEHERASNRSAGAVVMTEDGETYLSVMSASLPEPEPEPEPTNGRAIAD